MTLTRDKEIWAIALWVEKHHGADGVHYIADQIATLAQEQDKAGMAMWLEVAERFEALITQPDAEC